MTTTDRPSAIVLGAGPGVGAAVARAFAERGYRIGLVGRTPAGLEELAEAARGAGGPVEWAAADVADPQALTAAVEELCGRAGRLDVLHHNASRYRPARSHELTAQDLLDDLAVGAASLVTAVRAALPQLREAGRRPGRATVLATGGGSADGPMAGAASLGVQKAALRNLVQAMAADLRPEGIHVATLTVRGTIADGTPFAAAEVARVLAGLAAESAGEPGRWRTVVDLTRDGPVDVR